MSVTSIVLSEGEKRTIGIDWSPWLTNEGTSISSYEVSAPYGVTVHADDETGGKVTALVSATRAGKVTVHAVMVDGQEDTQTMTIRVQK